MRQFFAKGIIFICLLVFYIRVSNAQQYGAVRLVGGRTCREGRVEVYYDGAWGTVCDDGWDNTDAEVVCRQLNLFERNALAISSAAFGPGNGPILLDDVACTGQEITLLSCSSAGITIHNCGHGEDAGVVCPSVGLATLLRHNCSGMFYIPEAGRIPCTCSTQSLCGQTDRLKWMVGSDVIATGSFGQLMLSFPSNMINRRHHGKMATCIRELSDRQHINFTNAVAYGPDTVSISAQELYDANGTSLVIVTCKVTALQPKEDSMVSWSEPCKGTSGFICTLISPEPVMSLTCRVTNTANNNRSLAASTVLSSSVGKVNLTYVELCTDRGPSHVILTCHVTGIGLLGPAFVEWSQPCQGQRGFSCTLTSSADGQRVNCSVTKNKLVLESSVVLRLKTPQCVDLSLLRWVIIGAGSGVGLLLIVLVIVITVVIVNHRRRQQNIPRNSLIMRPESERQSHFYSSITMSKCAAAIDTSPKQSTADLTSDPPEDDYEII